MRLLSNIPSGRHQADLRVGPPRTSHITPQSTTHPQCTASRFGCTFHTTPLRNKVMPVTIATDSAFEAASRCAVIRSRLHRGAGILPVRHRAIVALQRADRPSASLPMSRCGAAVRCVRRVTRGQGLDDRALVRRRSAMTLRTGRPANIPPLHRRSRVISPASWASRVTHCTGCVGRVCRQKATMIVRQKSRATTGLAIERSQSVVPVRLHQMARLVPAGVCLCAGHLPEQRPARRMSGNFPKKLSQNT